MSLNSKPVKVTIDVKCGGGSEALFTVICLSTELMFFYCRIGNIIGVYYEEFS